MRFGAFVPQGWRIDLMDIDRAEHWPTMLNVARAIEANGFESLWVFDHFHTIPVPTQEVTYEAWTLMASLAAGTDTVRLGQMCTCNAYRPPAYLAKVAASIDVISDGRVEMGIGAGWYEHEYLAYGYEFPKASVRIGQLAEGVEIMRRLWTEDEASFAGKYFSIDGAISQPKPVQAPHIPFWIAGGGEQLTLRVAARHAQYTNYGGDSPEEFKHKSQVLAEHCRDVGRDFEEITRSAMFTVTCAETEAGVQERLEWLRSRLGRFIDGDRLERRMRQWGSFYGTPEQLVARFGDWRAEGMEYAICVFPDVAYDTSSMELFASEVMPALSE